MGVTGRVRDRVTRGREAAMGVTIFSGLLPGKNGVGVDGPRSASNVPE